MNTRNSGDDSIGIGYNNADNQSRSVNYGANANSSNVGGIENNASAHPRTLQNTIYANDGNSTNSNNNNNDAYNSNRNNTNMSGDPNDNFIDNASVNNSNANDDVRHSNSTLHSFRGRGYNSSQGNLMNESNGLPDMRDNVHGRQPQVQCVYFGERDGATGQSYQTSSDQQRAKIIDPNTNNSNSIIQGQTQATLIDGQTQSQSQAPMQTQVQTQAQAIGLGNLLSSGEMNSISSSVGKQLQAQTSISGLVRQSTPRPQTVSLPFINTVTTDTFLQTQSFNLQVFPIYIH
ncbi:bromodomain-containing protein [Reticulomyxa filosa]|uniref:Bromodomain-containing protein n=1 Tax=Reticulomyxa filosa TaxID=46433 RepID=X6LUG2_RETFI|nr:bromodomain-containing protein [Reticulomyxa filosa]|eukprot:ETO05264.1 bromodomain-containing protein [Reticulomyxa filosa]